MESFSCRHFGTQNTHFAKNTIEIQQKCCKYHLNNSVIANVIAAPTTRCNKYKMLHELSRRMTEAQFSTKIVVVFEALKKYGWLLENDDANYVASK